MLFITFFLSFLTTYSYGASSQVNSIVQMCMTAQGNSLTVPDTAQTGSGSSGVPLYKVLTENNTGNTNTNSYQGFYDGSTFSATQFSTDSTHKFYVACVCANNFVSVGISGQFGVATAAFTSGTTTPPTGALYQTGAASQVAFQFPPNAGNVGGLVCYPMPFVFPTSSYPFWQQTTAQSQLTVFLVGKSQ